MSAFRGANNEGASPAKLAEWQARRYKALARRVDESSPDANLPLDMLKDPEATRRASRTLDT